jgi:hypothetical protein
MRPEYWASKFSMVTGLEVQIGITFTCQCELDAFHTITSKRMIRGRVRHKEKLIDSWIELGAVAEINSAGWPESSRVHSAGCRDMHTSVPCARRHKRHA